MQTGFWNYRGKYLLDLNKIKYTKIGRVLSGQTVKRSFIERNVEYKVLSRKIVQKVFYWKPSTKSAFSTKFNVDWKRWSTKPAENGFSR